MTLIAEELAKKQKEISVAEFFERNKQLLGFDSPVLVSPSAGLLRPGRSLTFRISLRTPPQTTDKGTVLWHTDAGDETRLAVVITR